MSNITNALDTINARIETLTATIADATTELDRLTTSRDALAALDVDVINNALALISDISAPAPADADTQKGRIANMLAANVKPADIARELNTHVSYVYTVRRQLRDAA